MFVLGLDISTRCTGICVRSADVCTTFYVRGDKDGWSIFDKANAVQDKLLYIRTVFGNPDKIVIEQSVTRMGRGMSSAHTINLLSRYNGIISWITYDIFNMEPMFVDVRVARKALGIQIKKGEDAKAKVMEFVIDRYDFKPDIGKTGKINAWSYDRADAMIMALYGETIL